MDAIFSGVHFVLYSRSPDEDRRFLADVLGLTGVDAGHGWLIFRLPPSEIAVHPASENFAFASPDGDVLGGVVYLMCADLDATARALKLRGVVVAPPQRAQWGVRTTIALPGGGSLGLYQPTHRTAIEHPRI